MLKPGVAIGEGDEALECYAKHTAQIEVTIHRYNTTTTKWMMFEGKTRRKCGPMVNVSYASLYRLCVRTVPWRRSCSQCQTSASS